MREVNRLVATACGVMLAGLAPAVPAIAPPGPADVATAVAEVLRTGRHPWLRWPNLSDVAPALRDLYGGEADGLVWFAGERPDPSLAGAVSALAAAAERGLDPADYDAARIEGEWKRLLTAAREVGAADRALFDLAVTAGVLREIDAVHHGRVDPRDAGLGIHGGSQGRSTARRCCETPAPAAASPRCSTASSRPSPTTSGTAGSSRTIGAWPAPGSRPRCRRCPRAGRSSRAAVDRRAGAARPAARPRRPRRRHAAVSTGRSTTPRRWPR